jgi:hypothetical protein
MTFPMSNLLVAWGVEARVILIDPLALFLADPPG